MKAISSCCAYENLECLRALVFSHVRLAFVEIHVLQSVARTVMRSPTHAFLPHRPNATQIHLAFADATNGDGAMRVTWATVGKTEASTTARVVLDDGRTFPALASHYTVPSRWWQPDGWVGWLYTAVRKPLLSSIPTKITLQSSGCTRISPSTHMHMSRLRGPTTQKAKVNRNSHFPSPPWCWPDSEK